MVGMVCVDCVHRLDLGVEDCVASTGVYGRNTDTPFLRYLDDKRIVTSTVGNNKTTVERVTDVHLDISLWLPGPDTPSTSRSTSRNKTRTCS